MNRFKYFFVDSGNYKGHYVAITNNVDWNTQKSIMGTGGLGRGALTVADHKEFYKDRGMLNTHTIWTISEAWADHNLSHQWWNKIVSTLKEFNIIQDNK